MSIKMNVGDLVVCKTGGAIENVQELNQYGHIRLIRGGGFADPENYYIVVPSRLTWLQVLEELVRLRNKVPRLEAFASEVCETVKKL